MLIVMNILNLDCFEPTEIVAPGSHYVTCQFDYISNYNRLMHFRIMYAYKHFSPVAAYTGES